MVKHRQSVFFFLGYRQLLYKTNQKSVINTQEAQYIATILH